MDEAREDMEQGWEEFDPSDPDESEPSASSDVAALGDSQHNALRTRRRRKE